MRHGLTIVPAGIVLVAALLGAGGPETPPPSGVTVLDERFGLKIAPIYLLLRPDVQLDMQLNQHQLTGARSLVARLRERGLSLKNKSEAAAQVERRAIDEEMARWLRHELSEAQQERLTQINLQWEGASAMRRPAVADYLALDQPQRLKVNRLLAERDQRRTRGLLAPGDFDRFSRQALAVLTPLQKEQWDSVLGTPCRFAIGQPAAAPGRPAGDPGLKARPQPPTR